MYLDLPGPRGTGFFLFIANDIGCGNQTKCKAILFSAIGEKTYRVLEDLCTPQKPSDKSLEEITQLLLEHFKPKHLVVTESFKFYSFLVRLKHLVFKCEFGSFLKRALRDKSVCGLKDEKIQEKLLPDDKSLEEAVKMAKAMKFATPFVLWGYGIFSYKKLLKFALYWMTECGLDFFLLLIILSLSLFFFIILLYKNKSK